MQFSALLATLHAALGVLTSKGKGYPYICLCLLIHLIHIAKPEWDKRDVSWAKLNSSWYCLIVIHTHSFFISFKHLFFTMSSLFGMIHHIYLTVFSLYHICLHICLSSSCYRCLALLFCYKISKFSPICIGQFLSQGLWKLCLSLCLSRFPVLSISILTIFLSHNAFTLLIFCFPLLTTFIHFLLSLFDF